MDQFSVHLDRGWDLVQRGDTRGAEASARRALEIDPQSPEAFNLLGYVAALEGDPSEAIENYRQAIALDETYLEAMLNAAEVYIHPLGDFDQAVEMCSEALDLAETDEEIIDALLLKFDALLGKGDTGEAALVIGRVPDGPYKNANHAFLIGRAYYEIGEIDRAAVLIEEAVAREPNHAEGHYYLGLVRDERGDIKGATSAFLRCRQLDGDYEHQSETQSDAHPREDVGQGRGEKHVAKQTPPRCAVVFACFQDNTVHRQHASHCAYGHLDEAGERGCEDQGTLVNAQYQHDQRQQRDLRDGVKRGKKRLQRQSRAPGHTQAQAEEHGWDECEHETESESVQRRQQMPP